QERRIGFLDVRRRRRREEAGVDAARLTPGHRVERGLGGHGERVLVVIRHGALSARGPAPDLSERAAPEPVARNVSADTDETDRAFRHRPRPPIPGNSGGDRTYAPAPTARALEPPTHAASLPP